MVLCLFDVGGAIGRSVILLAAAIGSIMVASSYVSHAASLERTGGGGIVFSMFGERLHFREQDAAKISFLVPQTIWHSKEQPDSSICQNPFHKHTGRLVGATLGDWLNDEQFGRCVTEALSRLEQHDPDVYGHTLDLRIALTVEDGLAFPGAVPAANLPTPEYKSQPLSFGLLLNSVWGGNNCDYEKPEGEQDDLGFVWHPDTFHIDERDKWSLYSLSAGHRGGQVTRDLCVMCSYGITDDPRCFESLQSTERTVELRFSWVQGVPDELHPRIVSNARWIGYDKAARGIANSIFADRLHGFLQ